MALIEWNDNLSVGIKEIDEQHKVLVQLVNQLHGAMMRGEVKSATGPLLHELVAYTKKHFSAEEALMVRGQYPDYRTHQEEHKKLTGQVVEYVERYERGEMALSVHLLTFLRDWLVNHIQKEDRAYGPYLNSRGIK